MEVSFTLKFLSDSWWSKKWAARKLKSRLYRYEPSLNLPRESYDTGEEFVVEQSTETGVFAFKVKRPSENHTVWDTTIGEGHFRFVCISYVFSIYLVPEPACGARTFSKFSLESIVCGLQWIEVHLHGHGTFWSRETEGLQRQNSTLHFLYDEF